MRCDMTADKAAGKLSDNKRMAEFNMFSSSKPWGRDKKHHMVKSLSPHLDMNEAKLPVGEQLSSDPVLNGCNTGTLVREHVIMPFQDGWISFGQDRS
jgi:hypothetical protein